MTPKEKAKQLIEKFELVERKEKYQDEINLFEAKQCALICVDEAIYFLKEPLIGDRICKENIKFEVDYLKQVKHEISLL